MNNSFPAAVASVAGGLLSGQNVNRFRYWTPIGGTNAAKTSIPPGTVCVPAIRQRGAYTDATGTTRAAVGGAPNYTAAPGDAGHKFNVTVINDQGTPAPATRAGFVAVLRGSGDVANGTEGEFVTSGPCLALVSGAVNSGDRLDLDVTNNTNAGLFKVAAANGTVYAIARQTLGAAGLCFVELVTPHQATTAGNA